eukprot:4654862-Pyramimonas_sp.AAC.1
MQPTLTTVGGRGGFGPDCLVATHLQVAQGRASELPRGTADPVAKVAARRRAAEAIIQAARERRRDAVE